MKRHCFVRFDDWAHYKFADHKVFIAFVKQMKTYPPTRIYKTPDIYTEELSIETLFIFADEIIRKDDCRVFRGNDCITKSEFYK